MDLLFKRYASPFILLDNLIATNSLTQFIIEMWETVNEEKLWDYFVHKVFDKSWNEFIEEVKPKKTEKIDVGATLIKSKNMLENFTP